MEAEAELTKTRLSKELDQQRIQFELELDQHKQHHARIVTHEICSDQKRAAVEADAQISKGCGVGKFWLWQLLECKEPPKK